MKWFLHSISCLLALTGFCQKPVVSLSVNSKSVEVGEVLELTIKSNVTGDVKIVSPDEFILGYVTMQGEQSEMNSQTGKISTVYTMTQNGAFKENGTYTLTAYITNQRKVYKSNTVTIKVEKKPAQDEEISNKTLRQPVFGLIQRSKSRIYEGEPLVLESKIFSRFYVNFMPAYYDYEIDGKSEVHALENPRVLYRDKEVFRGQQYYTLTNAKKLVFLSAPGKYKIKPFETILQYDNGGLILDQFALTSLSSYVEVMPLPDGAPKDFIGGVGKFELETSLASQVGKEGDVIRLLVTVSGTGNLQNIDVPKLRLPKGISLYGDPEIEENINYGSGGAEGKITYAFSLQLLSGGKLKLPGVSIAYFDPEQKKYVSLKAKAYQIEVSGGTQTLIAEDHSQVQPVQDKESMAFIEKPQDAQHDLYSSKWFWPGVVSPVLLAFFGGIFWTRKEKITGRVVEKNQRRKIYASLQSRLEEIKLRRGEQKAAILDLEILLRSFVQLFPESHKRTCSKQELIGVLRENQIPEELVIQTESLLIRCEEARYSVFDDENQLQQLVSESQELLHKLA